MGMSGGFLVLEFLFRFLPYLLDTGIQIWNAVEVNNMTLPAPEVCKDICPPDAQFTWQCSGIEDNEYIEIENEYDYDEYKSQQDFKLKCLQSNISIKTFILVNT